jgi:hypothetical protein
VPIRFLIHDRYAKFPVAFDRIFEADDMALIGTRFRSPKANAFAEWWVRSVREECLGHVFTDLSSLAVEKVDLQYDPAAAEHECSSVKPYWLS